MDAEHTGTHDPAATATDRVSNRMASAGAARTSASGQLHLHIGDRTRQPDWRLDEETRALGRRGIAQARAALRSARADHLDRGADELSARPAASSRRPTAA